MFKKSRVERNETKFLKLPVLIFIFLFLIPLVSYAFTGSFGGVYENQDTKEKKYVVYTDEGYCRNSKALFAGPFKYSWKHNQDISQKEAQNIGQLGFSDLSVQDKSTYILNVLITFYLKILPIFLSTVLFVFLARKLSRSNLKGATKDILIVLLSLVFIFIVPPLLFLNYFFTCL